MGRQDQGARAVYSRLCAESLWADRKAAIEYIQDAVLAAMSTMTDEEVEAEFKQEFADEYAEYTEEE